MPFAKRSGSSQIDEKLKTKRQQIIEEERNGFTEEMKLKANILAHKALSTFYNELDIVKLADDYDNVVDL